MHGPRNARTSPAPTARSASTAASITPCGQAAMPGVGDADRVVAREHDRRAVGGHDRERQTHARVVTDASATGSVADAVPAAFGEPATTSRAVHLVEPHPLARIRRGRGLARRAGGSARRPRARRRHGRRRCTSRTVRARHRRGDRCTRSDAAEPWRGGAAGCSLSAGTRARRSRRRRDRARRRRRASLRRRDRARSRRCRTTGSLAARLRSGRTRRR